MQVGLDEGRVLGLQMDDERNAEREDVAQIPDVVVLEADVSVPAAYVQRRCYKRDIVGAIDFFTGFLQIDLLSGFHFFLLIFVLHLCNLLSHGSEERNTTLDNKTNGSHRTIFAFTEIKLTDLD